MKSSLDKSLFNFNTPSGFFGAVFLAMSSMLSFMATFFLNSAVSWFVSYGNFGGQWRLNNATNFMVYTTAAGAFAAVLLIVGALLLVFSLLECRKTPPSGAGLTGLLGIFIVAWLLIFLFVVNPVLFVGGILVLILGTGFEMIVHIVTIGMLGLFFLVVPGLALLGSAYFTFIRKQ